MVFPATTTNQQTVEVTPDPNIDYSNMYLMEAVIKVEMDSSIGVTGTVID